MNIFCRKYKCTHNTDGECGLTIIAITKDGKCSNMKIKDAGIFSADLHLEDIDESKTSNKSIRTPSMKGGEKDV